MTTAEITLPTPATGRKAGGRTTRRPAVLAAVLVLGLVVLGAIAPGLFTHSSPTGTDMTQALVAPGGAHWFGTDQLGRDVFT